MKELFKFNASKILKEIRKFKKMIMKNNLSFEDKRKIYLENLKLPDSKKEKAHKIVKKLDHYKQIIWIRPFINKKGFYLDKNIKYFGYFFLLFSISLFIIGKYALQLLIQNEVDLYTNNKFQFYYYSVVISSSFMLSIYIFYQLLMTVSTIRNYNKNK